MLLQKCSDLVKFLWEIHQAESSDWSTPAWSSSWSLVNWGFLSAFPPSCACAHHHVCLYSDTLQFPVKASFSAEKGAVIRWKSWNPDCWVTPSWPRSSPWPGKLVGTFRFLVFFFYAPPASLFLSFSLSLSLSLWGTFQRSPTQTLTQVLCSYFSPNARNTLIFQAVSSVRQVDNRHPLIQTATVSAESVHFVQCGVLPQGRLRILQKKGQTVTICWFMKYTIIQTAQLITTFHCKYWHWLWHCLGAK